MKAGGVRAALVLLSCLLAGADVTVRAEEGFLTASDYRKGQLRGFTLDESRHGEEDFVALASTGANLVRLMLPVKRCQSCREYRLDFPRDYVAFVVRMGGRYGFRVVINLVVHPSSTRSEYWSRPELLESLALIWQQLAAEHAENPVVAGFDLINEPNPPVGDHGEKVEQWRKVALRLIAAIRKVNRRHAIIVALPGIYWKSATTMRKLPDDNLVYTVHPYDLMEITHQGVHQYPLGEIYPSGRFDRGRLWGWFLAPVSSFSKRENVAIYVGEFSCVRWAAQNGCERFLRDLIELVEEQGWAWTYHSFRGYRGWNAEIEPGSKEEVLTRGARREWSHKTDTMKLLRAHFTANRSFPKIAR
jgi:hypothetical protein